MNALGSLGIDWKLLIAQLVNFGAVVFVSWRWGYRPLLKAIEERRGKIDKGLADAHAAEKAKADAVRDAETAVLAARREAQRLVEEAVASSEKLRDEGAARARKDVERILADGRARLEGEKEKMIAGARKDVAELVVMTAEKAVAGTMTAKREKTMLEETVKKMLS